MRFFDRMTRLVKSDAHGVLDQLEERSLLLKQHLREAELELSRKRARAEALEEEQRRLREEAERLDARVAALDEDVELARRGDKPELARFAVRRLLPVREAAREVKARIAEIGAARDRLGDRLEEQAAELEELRSRVRAKLAERAREEHRARTTPDLDDRVVSDEEVELELLRRSRPASLAGEGA